MLSKVKGEQKRELESVIRKARRDYDTAIGAPPASATPLNMVPFVSTGVHGLMEADVSLSLKFWQITLNGVISTRSLGLAFELSVQ